MEKTAQGLKDSFYIALYLIAIVIANTIVAWYGQAALVVTAFLLIPFDLVVRDVLHNRWHGNYLWPKMAGLILAGSVLTYLLNADTLKVAVASFVAFCAAGFVDAIVYHILYKQARLIKINTSNLFSALTDSIVFPFLAFDVVSLSLSGAQWAMKFTGGIFWSLVLIRGMKV